MKLSETKRSVIPNKWHPAMLFAVVCLLSIGYVSGTAQLKSDKRITAIQLGSAAEGARVTLVADAPLGDYEAFRRGERFYVRIPLSDFGAPQPGFHGDGFDDVQVQRVGDSIVVSFKLQPGATARVDQHGNHLEVIFTSPARSQRSVSSNTTASKTSSPSSLVINRSRDSAGPEPPDTPVISRQRVVHQTSEAPIRQSEIKQSSESSSPTHSASPKTQNSASTTPVPFNVASPSPQQQNSPGWTTNPATTSTPFTSHPTASTTSSSASKTNQGLNSWFAGNRKYAILGGLLALAALGAVLLFRRSRQTKTKTKSTRVQPVLSQPKYSTEVERDVFAEQQPEVAPSPVDDSFITAADITEAEEVDWRAPNVEPSTTSTPRPAVDDSALVEHLVSNGASNEEREVFEL